MQFDDKLLAAITPRGNCGFMAAVVDMAAAPSGLTAKQLCASRLQARLWIEQQAEVLGRPVLWVSEGVMGMIA
jgi:uncharacterized protein (DUF2336 family)